MSKAAKEDELIRYLHMARNTDEHTANPVVRKQPAGISINGSAPGRGLYIRRLEFMRDGSFVLNAPLGATVEAIPPKVEPEILTNRYGEFPLPTSHRGEKLESTDLTTLGKLGLEFYRDAFKDLESVGWDS